LAGSGSPEEKKIREIIEKDGKFEWNGKEFEVIKCAKPKSKTGEPKTDVFVDGHNKTSNEFVVIKISYKKENWMPVENKVTRERMPFIYGDEWKNIAKSQNMEIKNAFNDRHIVFLDKSGKTEGGTITLGWRYEIGYESARKPLKDGKPQLRTLGVRIKEDIHDQVYWGKGCREDYRDCNVDGNMINDSGIPDYALERDVFIKDKNKKIIGQKTKSTKDIFENLEPIKEFSKKHKDLDVTYRAQNYRMHLKKKCKECKTEYRRSVVCPQCGSKKIVKPITPIQGEDRDLPVYVEWSVIGGKLDGKIILDKPFTKVAKDVLDNFRECLNEMGITDDNNFDISMLKGKLTDDTSIFIE